MSERSQIIAKKLFLQGRLDALEKTIAMLEGQRERTAASIESLEEELKGGGRDDNAC
jgi:chaperonin cofactor prefoldin